MLNAIIYSMLYFLLLIVELIILFILSGMVTKQLSFFFLRLTRSQGITIRLMALLFLPGVIIHEVSHYATAVLLGVTTHGMEFVPQVSQNNVKLGSVTISQTDPVRRLLIGVAPLVVGLMMSFAAFALYFSSIISLAPIWKTILLIYILFEIGNTMFSSRKDLEGSMILIVLMVISMIVVYLFYPQSFSLLQQLLEKNASLLRQGATLLSVPVGIDIGVVLITKLFTKRRP